MSEQAKVSTLLPMSVVPALLHRSPCPKQYTNLSTLCKCTILSTQVQVHWKIVTLEYLASALTPIRGLQIRASMQPHRLIRIGRAGRPGWVVKYSVRNGGHGFDAVHTVEEDWLREGVEFFKGYWLGDN